MTRLRISLQQLHDITLLHKVFDGIDDRCRREVWFAVERFLEVRRVACVAVDFDEGEDEVFGIVECCLSPVW